MARNYLLNKTTARACDSIYTKSPEQVKAETFCGRSGLEEKKRCGGCMMNEYSVSFLRVNVF